jgi:hypothetical protein
MLNETRTGGAPAHWVVPPRGCGSPAPLPLLEGLNWGGGGCTPRKLPVTRPASRLHTSAARHCGRLSTRIEEWSEDRGANRLARGRQNLGRLGRPFWRRSMTADRQQDLRGARRDGRPSPPTLNVRINCYLNARTRTPPATGRPVAGDPSAGGAAWRAPELAFFERMEERERTASHAAGTSCFRLMRPALEGGRWRLTATRTPAGAAWRASELPHSNDRKCTGPPGGRGFGLCGARGTEGGGRGS